MLLHAELDKNLPNADIVITSPYYPGDADKTRHAENTVALQT
jgi:hypothetical protein